MVGDEKTGVNILKRALEAPLRQLVENAGLEGSVVVEEVKKRGGHFGFNAAAMEYQDLIENGIIDPTKVVRTALENAVSAAYMLLTTAAVVVNQPEEKKKGMNPGMMGMGEDY